MARVSSTVDILVNQRLQGSGVKDSADGLKKIADEGRFANTTIGDMKKRLKELNKELDGLSRNDDGFAGVTREIRDINKELKRATRLADDLDDEFDKVGNSVGLLDIAMGNLLAGGISSIVGVVQNAGAALIDFGRDAIQLGSDAKETTSLLQTSLGPAFQQYIDDVQAIADATGQSAIAFQQANAPIIAMTKAQGFAADEAARLSTFLGQAALDLNSFYNSSTGFEDIQSLLAGSAETVQKYGLNLNATNLSQIAFAEGITDTIRPLTQQERTLAIVAGIQKQAADALGDAARTAEGFANTTRANLNVINDFKTAVGESLVDAVLPLNRELLELSRSTLPGLADELDGIIQDTGEMAVGLVEVTKQLKAAQKGFEQTVIGDVFGEAFRDTVNQLAPNLQTAFQTTQIGLQYLEDMGEEINLAEQNAQRFESRMAAIAEHTRTASEKADLLIPFEDTEPIDYVIDRLSTLQDIQTNINEATFDGTQFSEIDFSGLDAAFGTATTSVSTLETAFENAVAAADTLIRKSTEFSASDFFATEADDTGFLSEVAEQAANAGVSIPVVLQLLQEDGTPIEDLQAIGRELLEDAAAESLAVDFAAGVIGEDELISKAQNIATEFENLEDPLSIITQGATEVATALNDLNSDFQSRVTLTIDGLDELREASTLISLLSNRDIAELPESANFGSPTSAAARRR